MRLPWLRLPDHLPEENIDAIYVPGFCLTLDKQRLTTQNRSMIEEAIRQIQSSRAKYLIFSGCYDDVVSYRELTLRRELANKNGIANDRIRTIRNVVNTKDELQKLALALNVLNAKNVLLVSDEYHMPRLARWAKLLLQDTKIFHISVRPPAYEFAWERNLVKIIRSGAKPLWILWNILLYLATPLLIKTRK